MMSGGKCRLCGVTDGHAAGCPEHINEIASRRVITNDGPGQRVAMTEFEVEFARVQAARYPAEMRNGAFQIAMSLRAADEPIAVTLQRAREIENYVVKGEVPSAEVAKLRAMN